MNYRIVGLSIAALLSLSNLSPAGVTAPASSANDKGKEEDDALVKRRLPYNPIDLQCPCPSEYLSSARGFAEAVQKGDVDYVKQFLHEQSPEHIAYVFGRVFRVYVCEHDPICDCSARIFASPFHIATVWEQVEVLRVLLGYIIIHPELAPEFFDRLLDAQGHELPQLLEEAALLGHTDVVRVLLEFADEAPHLAHSLFTHQAGGFTALRQAIRGDRRDIVRLLVDFAARRPELALSLFTESNLDRENDQPLPYAMAKGYVEIVRMLLASVWSGQLQNNLKSAFLPENPELRIAIWTAIIEHRPDLVAKSGDAVLQNIGRVEAAVMARDLEALKKLLSDGVLVDDVLLATMLQNARHFDREAFKRFVQELETLLDPSLAFHGQILFARFLGTQPPYPPPPSPMYEEELRRIIQILRERVDGHLETAALEGYIYAMRNLGRYGLPNQFAHEDAARDTLVRLAPIHLAELRVPPGVRLFTHTMAALLTMIYFENFGTMPRK